MFTMVKSSLMLLKNKNKRNIIVTMFFCAMLMSFMGFNTFALTGSGTYDDPFIIKDSKDLCEIKKHIEIDDNWSNKKYFSLQNDIEISDTDFIKVAPITRSGTYGFDGIFNGNGHSIRLVHNGGLFGNIRRSGIIKNLTVGGNGYFSEENHGKIINCKSLNADTLCGIVRVNWGYIQECEANGKYGNGIAQFNYGRITECLISGEINGNGGVVDSNGVGGEISHCRVKSNIISAQAVGGLSNSNNGIIFNCTMNGIFSNESKNNVYLLLNNYGDGLVVQCVVGKNTVERSTACKNLFGVIGKVYGCGYESEGVKDCCFVK